MIAAIMLALAGVFCLVVLIMCMRMIPRLLLLKLDCEMLLTKLDAWKQENQDTPGGIVH